MTQDEKWLDKYNEVVEFIQTHHRNPSKHRRITKGAPNPTDDPSPPTIVTVYI